MLTFIAKRLVQSVLVMLTVALIAFSLFRYVGDPINNMVGQDTTLEQREELKERLGLNDSFMVQFGRFVTSAAQGEFGFSYQHRRPVSELIAERLPATLELSIVSALLALLIGVPMGVYTAIRRNSFLSHSFMTLSLIGISLPTFLIGILLILLFGVILRWLPTFRARRRGATGLVVNRAADGIGPEVADHAVHHAGAVPDDTDYAAGAI
jgi:peptide/nickel transport system permease protein